MAMRSVLAGMLLATVAQAGVAQQPERPRVGLVLGGGGARGAAHVGVLRVIDELRIPVDAIAGTSMGAIVGALYAIGLSPAEIESRFQTVDWDAVFDNRPSRRNVEYRRKQDDPHLLVRFELGFGGGRLRLPAGLVEPHRANLLLRTLTLPAAGIRDFDRLPIPFRAVATDIATGEVVVLDHGDLAEAIMASMSIPGVFAPVIIEGRHLVDGGVVRNLPVDVARSMDVDVLIVVDVGAPLTSAEALRSAVGVYGQTLTIFVRANSDEQIQRLTGDDVLVAPGLGSIGTGDFHRTAEAIEIGRAAADRLRHRLERLAVTPLRYAAARSRLPEPRVEVLEFVRLENDSRFSDRLIGGRLALRAGDTVSSGTLNAAIDRVWGLGVFQKVDFRFVQEADRRGLVVRTTEKPWGPNYLRFGLGLTDEPDGNSTFDLRANLAMTGLNALGADLRAELRAGEIRGMSVELYQPATWSGRLFVAPRLQVRHTPGDAFESRVRIAQYDIEQRSIGFDAGTQLGTWGQFRIGIEHRAVDAKPEIGDPSLPRFDVAHRVLGARLDIDRIDDVLFPEDGLLASVRYERASSADSVPRFDRVLANLLVAGTRGPHTLLAGLHVGTALGSELPLYEEFELGGFMWLSGLRRRQIAGRYLGLARLMYYRRVGDAVGFSVAGGLRVGGSIEIGNAWQAPPAAAANALRFGGSLFAGIETVLGPLYGAYGIGDGGQRAWYLLLGQPL